MFNYFSFEGIDTSGNSFFGGSQDTAPLVWDTFHCQGTETSLTQCYKENNGFYSECTHTAGIYCTGQTSHILIPVTSIYLNLQI